MFRELGHWCIAGLFINLPSTVPLQYGHKTKCIVTFLSASEFKNLSKKTESRTIQAKTMKAILQTMGKANTQRHRQIESQNKCFSSIVWPDACQISHVYNSVFLCYREIISGRPFPSTMSLNCILKPRTCLPSPIFSMNFAHFLF